MKKGEKETARVLISFMILLTVSSVLSIQIQEAYATDPTVGIASQTGSAAGSSTATTQIEVTFLTPVNATTATTTAAWSVTGFTIASVDSLPTVNCQGGGGDSNLIITLTSAMATDATPDVTYDGTGPNISIRSCDTNTPLVNATVISTTDGLSPTMDSATTTSTTTIDVTYSEDMDTGGSITTGDYTITNPSVSVLGVSVSGSVVTLTVSAMGQDDTPTVAQPGSVDDTSSNTLTAPSSVLASDATVNRKNGSGCEGDCEEPTLGLDNRGQRLVDNGFSYNGKSVDVEYYFTPYPLVTVQVGKQNVAEFKIYENMGPDSISHFELAFGLANGESIGMSKAVINWDKTFDGVETITLDDPENVLDSIKVTTSEGSCSDELQQKCLIVKVKHTFRAPLDFNILGTNVWDAKRNAWQNYYNHGIEVVGESLNPPKEYDGINKGHIYHLTETGKDTAVDEFGNSWSLKYV